ncbi:MAG: CPBP family intramembrane metalloprotease [Oscillospiraceae bacterium]|nr:CPBP family intramembrane metalloprotease [Oscillospiraceae bacterium]
MWERINKFVHSHVVLTAFFISALFLSILAMVFGIPSLNMTPMGGLAFFTVGQVMLSAIAIWLMRKLQIFNVDDFKFKNMGKGFLLAGLAIIMAAISFFTTFTQLPENSFIAPNPLNLLIVVLHPFIGTGAFEEILIRGLVLKILLIKMGGSRKGILHACVISSVIFGVVHIVNLINGDVALVVGSQIVYATAFGVFFTALFLRTRTLWIPILIHGLVNLSGQIFNAIVDYSILQQFNTQAQTEIDILGHIITLLLITVPLLVVGFVLLRKVKPEDVETIMPASIK